LTFAARITPELLPVLSPNESDLPEGRSQVFDRFYRSPAARSLRGSGLGLAIVRQTALAHGAEAEASNAAGGGALLTIRFPTADASAASLAPRP
jgi:signal transduction histidine kinase